MKHVSLVPALLYQGAGSRYARAAWWRNQRQATAWLAKTLIAGGFLAGSSAFAQYSPATQSYAPAYGTPSSPIYAQPLPEAANQSDEQLLTVGRLLEQQGRYAQAQRIYTELERRRLAGMQQRVTPPPSPNYQPQPMPAPQAYSPPTAWQASPMQAATQAPPVPMMQLAPQVNMPVYGQRPQSIAPLVQASAQLPPPAPPSEVYVVDREITPAPKTSTPQPSEGWRSAFAPLPAALRSWSLISRRPISSKSARARPGRRCSHGRVAADSNSLPDSPSLPSRPGIDWRTLPAEGTAGRAHRTAAIRAAGRRVRRSADARLPGRGAADADDDAAQTDAGKRLESLEPERDAQELTSQTESIRIIPGQRSSLQLKPEANHTPIDLVDQPPAFARRQHAAAEMDAQSDRDGTAGRTATVP